MNLKAFKQAGHWPTLLAAFLYFDVSFMDLNPRFGTGN